MSETTPSETTPPDGRSLRRERNRAAVIDAVFTLVDEGKIPPQVEEVAERSGVSVSSIFRNFDGLADLQRQAIDHAHKQWSASLEVDDDADPLDARIRSHVRSRIELYERSGGLMRLARARAVDFEPLTEALANQRANLADQTRARFATEVANLSPAAAADLVAIVDTITSPEAFEVMSASHARSSRQISRAWITTLSAVLKPANLTTESD